MSPFEKLFEPVEVPSFISLTPNCFTSGILVSQIHEPIKPWCSLKEKPIRDKS